MCAVYIERLCEKMEPKKHVMIMYVCQSSNYDQSSILGTIFLCWRGGGYMGGALGTQAPPPSHPSVKTTYRFQWTFGGCRTSSKREAKVNNRA